MASGRTIWMGIDVAFMRRENNITLALEAGPEAWGVLLNLWLEAKEQRSANGSVKFGFTSIGQRIGLAPGRVEEVVRKAVEIGALSDLREKGRVCKAVLTDFVEDDRRGGEALRKQDQRRGTDRDRPGQDDELSRDVPNCPPRVEESREEVTTLAESSGLDASASKVSELFAYWQQRCGHPHAKLTSDRRSKLKARLKDGYTVEQIRQGIDGAALDAFVDEKGKRFDDLELICRNGSKLESFVARAAQSDDPTHVEVRPEDAWTRRERRWQEKCTADGVCWNCAEDRPQGASNYCATCLASQEAT